MCIVNEEYSKLDPDDLIDTPMLAKWFGVSESYLNKGRTFGTGPKFVKVGVNVRYRVGDVREWIDEKKQAQTRIGLAVVFHEEEPELDLETIKAILEGSL